MKCPRCTDATLAITHRTGIEVDTCPRCRGVWLDRNELDRLVGSLAVTAKPVESSAAPDEFAPQPSPFGAEGDEVVTSAFDDRSTGPTGRPERRRPRDDDWDDDDDDDDWDDDDDDDDWDDDDDDDDDRDDDDRRSNDDRRGQRKKSDRSKHKKRKKKRSFTDLLGEALEEVLDL